MSTIVIMPGGFHPFHAGHYALYKSAVEAFPDADVYVAATDAKTERPFPFAIKEKLAKVAGVPTGKFIQVKSPFKAEEITQHYDPNRDVLIFVRSEKDRDESPKPGGTKKDGTPAYFQPYDPNNLQPFAKHAYFAYLPTVKFGPGIKSATEIRNAWPNLDDRRKTAMVMSLYPATQKNLKLATNVVKMIDMGMGSAPALKEDTNPKIDLTPNFPNYQVLVAEFMGVQGGKLMLKIVDAQLKPGVKDTEKIAKAIAANRPILMAPNYVKNRAVVGEGEVVPFKRPASQLTWEQLPKDVLLLANEWYWASEDDSGLEATLDPKGIGSGTKNAMQYAAAKLQQKGWSIDYNDEYDKPGEYNLRLTNKRGQTVLLPLEDAQEFKGWAAGTSDLNEDPYEYRAPGASMSQTRNVIKKMNPTANKFIWKRPNQIGGSFTEQELLAKGFKKSQYNSWGGTQSMWDRLLGVKEDYVDEK